MYTVSHDYYAILGVSKDATTEEIRAQWKRLMKEHHTDPFNGLRTKYGLTGDEVLLKILEDKIKDEEEFCKLLNEAYGVLSDPDKRRKYDNEKVDIPAVEAPKISIFPKSVSFGTLGEDEKKAVGFTIRNSGGPVQEGMGLDWENGKPSWGEFVYEVDEENIFPIQVTITVATKGVKPGRKQKRIVFTAEGRTYYCEVFLAIRSKTSIPVTPPPKPTPPPAPKPSPKPATPPKPVDPPPDLVISETKIDFGTLEKGLVQVEAFVITNRGGPASNIQVDWDGPKPDWAELVTEHDPIFTFPVKVSVRVDTTKTTIGSKLGKIKVTVN